MFCAGKKAISSDTPFAAASFYGLLALCAHLPGFLLRDKDFLVCAMPAR